MKQNTKKILFFACMFILFFMAFHVDELEPWSATRPTGENNVSEQNTSILVVDVKPHNQGMVAIMLAKSS